ELGDQVAVDLALVGTHRSERALLAAAVQLRADQLDPPVRVLGEPDRPGLLIFSLGAKTSAARLGRLPLAPGDLRVHRGQPRARIGLREERQRLVIVGAGRIGNPIGSGVPDLPAAGGELPQPAPRLALARTVLPLRRAHHALRWTIMDRSAPPCPSVPLAP